jgi:putative membrane protein
MSEFQRQHPVAAITQLLAVLRQNLVPILIFVFVGARNTDEYFWYFFIFGIVSTFFLGIASWYRFTFRVHEDELQINKGIFVRKKLYLTKDRIQVIDITEGLVQRVFGLVKVEVKSAGSGTESATISAITRDEAIELRSILRGETKKADQEPEEEETEGVEVQKEPSPTWKLSGKHLFYAALTSGNFGLIASILGAASGQLDQFINEENLNYIFDHIPGFSNMSVVIGMIIFILLVSYLFSFFGVIFKYADFKVEKKDKELHITSGLLERKHITVPFNRIQAVRFVEGVFRQPFGFGMVYVESAGFEQQNQEKSIVLFPFMRKSELRKHFGEFLPDYDEPEEQVAVPSRAFLRYLRRPNYLVFIAAPIVWFFWEYGWTLFALTVPLTMYGWLRFKDAGVLLSDQTLKMTFRNMAKHTAFVKRNRVQVSDVSINPFQIRKKLGTLHVTAASGAGGRTFAVNDLDVEEAYAVLKWPLSKQHKQRTKLFESPQESTSSDQTTTGTQQTSGV